MEFSVSEKLWLLCELEAYGGRPNYAIFDSEEVIGQPLKSNMLTGKTVKIRKGKITIQGKIIVISDDKEFLEKELKHYRKNNVGHQLPSTTIEESPTKLKRRRTIHDALPAQHHQQLSWMPHMQHQKERILTPSSSLQSLNSITRTATPPMTFDQQTQTDKKRSDDDNVDTSNVNKLRDGIETILENQKKSQHETIELKRIIVDLSKQVQILTANLHDLSAMTKDNHHNSSKPEQQLLNNSGPHMNHESSSTSYKIDDTEIIYNDSNGNIVSNTGDEVIFTFENEDTNLSNSNNTTTESFNESMNKSNNTKQHLIKIEHVTEKALEKYTTKKVLKSLNLNSTVSNSLNSSRSGLNSSRILNGSTTSLASHIINEWKDDSTNEDYVLIGNNGTKIPKYVMTKINWASHTNATRGLLMSLFSRETLSTHSLTGKPSPAFMDRKKPAKEQLDAKIVADIIQFVTTQCNVPESVVRNAITTKCADENKMSRQKRNSMVKVSDFNKENAGTANYTE